MLCVWHVQFKKCNFMMCVCNYTIYKRSNSSKSSKRSNSLHVLEVLTVLRSKRSNSSKSSKVSKSYKRSKRSNSSTSSKSSNISFWFLSITAFCSITTLSRLLVILFFLRISKLLGVGSNEKTFPVEPTNLEKTKVYMQNGLPV